MTVHDFTLYKHGTLERRVERRMALAGVKTAAEYFDLLRRDANERDQLSRDLLINVTGFFRDPAVFEFLAESVIPDLVRDHPLDRPLRIWVAGCSSGEETYSLAMLFREQIDASKREIKLQIFATDVDPDAVASARDGLYPQLDRGGRVARNDWRGFFPGRITATASRPNCARTSCSRCTTCSPTRRSRVSISYRAGTF